MTATCRACLRRSRIAPAAARPRRAPHRRRHRRRRAAAEASARRAARSRSDLGALPERDRALVRHLVATVLRRLGTLRHLLAALLETRHAARRRRGSKPSLLIGAAQILFLDVPDHAAVDLSVRLAQADRHASHYAGLVNARAAASSRATARRRLAALDTVLLDTPDWLMQRWTAHYGEATARAIAAANAQEPALDLTVKSDPATWAGDARRPRAADRHGAHHRARPDPAAARLRRRRVVGAGRRRRAAGAAARRRARQIASPTSAPRPAARPRSSRTPARRSPRSTARAPRLDAAARESRAAAARRRDRRGRRDANGRAGRSTPCCSTRPAPRPAPSAAIPTSPGSSARPIWRSSTALQARLLDRAVDAAQARRHAGLLHLLAGARGGRGRRSRRCSAAIPACAAARSRPTRSRATPSC